MRKVLLTIALAGSVIFAAANNVSAQVINEVVMAAPGTDRASGCEYVELRGAPNSSLSGLSYVDVDGDASQNPGRINYVRDLSSYSFSSNGLIVIAARDTAGNFCRVLDPGANLLEDANFRSPGSTNNNGSNSFLLVTGSTAGLARDFDADANNDGTFDFAGANLTIVDGYAVRDSNANGGTTDILYAAELTRRPGTPANEAVNAFSRCGNDVTAQSATAIFYGDLENVSSTNNYRATASSRSVNFPASGQITPGAGNNNCGGNLRLLGSYATGVYDSGAAEIVAYDPTTRRLFVVNGGSSSIDVLDINNPSAPTLAFSISLAPYGRQANSVDVKNGIVAVAVEANVKTDPGKAVFFNASGAFLKEVTVGALPDMLVFTPDNTKVLVANEGEPNDAYTIDPEGSVSIVDISGGVSNATVTTANFAAFNGASLDSSIRIFGPGASVAQDLEPEYIAVSADSTAAYVTLQENNTLGIVNLTTGQFTALTGLGFKDHNLPGNGLDASDQNGGNINITNYPVFGMYQPDAIASFVSGGQTFLITANEGDVREYSGFNEAVRAGAGSYSLDPAVFANAAALKNNNVLGRLNVTRATGNTDGDGEYEAIYAFGARSFSIRNATGALIYDSGDDIEEITAAAYPLFFNASNTNNTKKNRSDDKGPEPEGVTVGTAYGRNYAFIGLERIGGVLVYDLTNPASPQFVQYFNNRNFSAATNTAAAGDLGPEGLRFIAGSDSPTGTPLLAVANEVSGTTSVYEFAPVN